MFIETPVYIVNTFIPPVKEVTDVRNVWGLQTDVQRLLVMELK